MTSSASSTHGHYVLLLSVLGVSPEVFDAAATSVNAAYMEQFGPMGAFTASVLRLGNAVEVGSSATHAVPWTMIIRYFGPTASVDWLQNELTRRAATVGATIQTATFEVEDVTGIY